MTGTADLVLEGGGVKGIGLVGAYSVLEENGYQVHRVAGTSAGAVAGALVAAGMSAKDLQVLMETLDYRQFKDRSLLDRCWPVGKLISLVVEKGIYEGDALHSWLDSLLTDLGKRTFGDMRLDDPGGSLPPKQSYRLVVMVSDITRGRLMTLPWDYRLYGLDPDKQLVADAVRASMSIPFFYEPVRFKARDDGGRATTCYLVDGGLLSNFPVGIFDRTDGRRPRWPTFGVKLSAQRPFEQPRYKVNRFIGLTKALAGTLTSFHDRIHIEDPAVLARTMFVDTEGVKATDFEIDELTQQTLYVNGRTAAERFLDKQWNFEEYIARFRESPGS